MARGPASSPVSKFYELGKLPGRIYCRWIRHELKMRITSSLSLTLSLSVLLASQLLYAQAPAETAQPQPTAFEQKLRESRYDLRLESGKFLGNAAPVLESAIANAQYVLIGEDHITREIP